MSFFCGSKSHSRSKCTDITWEVGCGGGTVHKPDKYNYVLAERHHVDFGTKKPSHRVSCGIFGVNVRTQFWRHFGRSPAPVFLSVSARRMSAAFCAPEMAIISSTQHSSKLISLSLRPEETIRHIDTCTSLQFIAFGRTLS